MRTSTPPVEWAWRAVTAQQGHLFPWAPVCLGAGIAIYFAQAAEPSPGVVRALALAAFAGLALALWPRLWLVARVLAAAGGLVALGIVLGSLRTGWVAGPVLERQLYGPVTGRIVAIDRSASDNIRLTLDRVVLDRLPPDRVPVRVRISVSGDGPHTAFLPGKVVGTMAFLAPPSGAAEPGGFDFRRHAWFLRLGAVGYTRAPVVAVAADGPGGWRLWITEVRVALSARIQADLPGPAGGVAAAIVTGDRSALDPGAVEDLRASNLAHLLAISGLHMGLAVGLFFGAVRGGLALWPHAALNWPVRRIAALAGLAGAAAYLAISGGNVATERAFVMAAVALGAVLLDRRALSLRGVAIAALIVLALRPEALMSPGFQMSFAATLALVAVFAALRDRPVARAPGWLRPVTALLISSSVAGLATAPFSAFHFNMFSHYGLVANMVSVPLMGAVIMPAAILGLFLMPLGLADWPLAVAGLGIDWVLAVAHVVAGWPGAVSGIAVPPVWILPVLVAAGLWLALMRGWLRLAAVPAVALALVQWGGGERPHVLIDASGGLVGIQPETGHRVLSRARGAGFVAGIWLENDGSRGIAQDKAAEDWAKGVAGWDIVQVAGKRAARSPPACLPGRIVVSDQPLALTGPCLVLDPDKLSVTGSIALWREGEGLRHRTVRQMSGNRPWSHGSAVGTTAQDPVADWIARGNGALQTAEARD